MLSPAERRAIAVRALTIYERLAARPAPHQAGRHTDQAGRRVLAAWNQVFSPGDAAAFERRLGWDGIEPHAVLEAVAAETFAALDLGWTAWLERFGAGARQVPRDRVFDDTAWRKAAGIDDGRSPFAELWYACALGVRDRCTPPAAAGLTARAFQDLVDQLMRELAVYGDRPAYERFDACRHADGRASSDRNGTTCYREYIIRTLDDELVSLFHEYPVAARQLARVADGWIASTGELLERLAADRPSLARVFNGGGDLGAVERIDAGLSDPHDGRRRVAILTFAAGIRVVYKPRPLAVDAAFERLIAWFVRHDLEPAPPVPRVLCRSGYGWAECIEQGECISQAAAARYFEQAGALLCLAHLLGARDLHMENLIASSNGPALVDLELLMQPDSRTAGARSDDTSGKI